MKKGYLYILFLIPAILGSCSLFENDPPADNDHPWVDDYGIYLLNEGNFMSGNGSVSFFSIETSEIYNDLFDEMNGRPLGDIPNAITLVGDMAFIVVNNSGKIEVAERSTLKSVKTIRELDSPRNLLAIDGSKAYVTSLWSKKITVIDLKNYSVSGFIEIRRSSEAITAARNKVYISCWASGNEIMVINPSTNKVSDSIKVGNEPESMVIDRNLNLWVLCTGGYSGQNYPQLISINTLTDKIEKVLVFPSKTTYPTSLCINNAGDTLYYIEGGIRRMSISDTQLPTGYFVPASGRTFYKIATDRDSGCLFATNAMDYQQKGYLLRINGRGIVTDSARAGIIPGAICFNRNLN